MRFLKPFLYILFFSTFIGCKNDRLDIDTSDSPIKDLTIDRLERDVFNLDTNNIERSTKVLQAKYGKFYNTYVSAILNNGGLKDSSYSIIMKSFIRDYYMRKAYEDSQKKYPNSDAIKEKLLSCYQRYHYHFPNKILPKPITMISGFNYPVVIADSTLAMGIEFYLDGNNEFYSGLGIPKYKSMFMNEENIVPDAIRQWMLIEFPNNMNKQDFLSEITYMGKIMYLMDALLPGTPDTLKIHYTNAQMEYCLQNEFNVWSYFAAQKLLYTTNQADIMKFTADGPFTSALSKEAPARIGHWIGWQLIRQYMNNNPDITLQALMDETEAQKILSKSKYKPRK